MTPSRRNPPRRPTTLPCPLCGLVSPRSPAPGRNPVWCCESCRTEFGFYVPSRPPVAIRAPLES